MSEDMFLKLVMSALCFLFQKCCVYFKRWAGAMVANLTYVFGYCWMFECMYAMSWRTCCLCDVMHVIDVNGSVQ